jgi:hypothetical protein
MGTLEVADWLEDAEPSRPNLTKDRKILLVLFL